MVGLPPAAPVVSPGPVLTAAERTRYARHLLLPGFGEDAQRRLRAARVLVVGAGGLGSPVLQYLAAAGVGRLTIVDDDVVDETNLQRQVIHREDSVGHPKVESAAQAVRRLSSQVEVVGLATRLTADNVLEVLAGHDVIVDGADNFPTRYLVSDACARLGLPHVWGSIHRFDAQLSVWWAGRGPCYRCAFPVEPSGDAVPSCAVGGVLGALCGTIGSLMAGEVITLVTGVGEPLVGRILIHDALTASFDVLPVRARPGCPVCGPNADASRPLGTTPDAGGSAASPAAPSEPVPAVSVVEAAARLAGSHPPLLLDVREPGERVVVALDGSVAIPLAELADRLDEVPPDRPVLVHCKTGGRSARATALLRAHGRDATNVEGGILAWIATLRPDLPRY